MQQLNKYPRGLYSREIQYFLRGKEYERKGLEKKKEKKRKRARKIGEKLFRGREK